VIESINPATGRVIARYERHSDRDIDRRLERAADDYAAWRRGTSSLSATRE
jgi:acyl-CoA reductase-like NAD-dependent aldehyde dehydrogenase